MSERVDVQQLLTVRPRPARLRHIRCPRCRNATAAPQVDAWLDWLEARQLRPSSIRAYEKRVQPLLRLHPYTPFGEFTETELVAALNSVPKDSRTLTITAFVSLFRTWAKERDIIAVDPTRKLGELRRPAHQKYSETFSEAEVEALTGLPGEDGLRMLLMFDTGLRIGELSELRVRDVQLDRGQLVVLDGKGGKDRVIPLTARLSSAFAEWSLLEGVGPDDYVFGHYKPGVGAGISHRALPMSTEGIRKWFYRRCDLVGARRLKPHTTRHTFATTLLRRDASITKVAKLLGHSSVDTTKQAYEHLVTEDLRGVMELLEL